MTAVQVILTYTMVRQVFYEGQTHETSVQSHITEMQVYHCEDQWICSVLQLMREAVFFRCGDHH